MFIDWIRAGLAKTGKSGKGLAGHLKRSESVVSRILSGDRQIKADELPRIADYLESEIPVAAGVRNDTNTTGSRRSGLGLAQSTALVPVMAVIAPAVWREAGGRVMARKAQVPAVPDPRLAGVPQYACELESDPGHFVICVNYFDIRQRPTTDDVVHVVRTRGEMHEDTLRKVAVNGDAVRLVPVDGKGQTLLYPARKSAETIEIKGLVVGRYNAVPF
jgi:hypothetical protein